MKIVYDVDIKEGNSSSISFTELTAQEFDNLRILFKTILDYGQFDESKRLSEELSLKSLIERISKEQ